MELVETQEGLTGYKESGSGKIPAMEVINTTNKYQPLAYEVSCLYQGEIYATHLVTLWVYPQTMYLNVGTIRQWADCDTDDVNFSWEPIPGKNYHYEVYICKQGESEFDYIKGVSDSRCHIENYNGFFSLNRSMNGMFGLIIVVVENMFRVIPEPYHR